MQEPIPQRGPASGEGGFADPAPVDRPKFRWWWPGGAVEEGALAGELGEMKAAGYGGAEIAVLPIGLTGTTGEESHPWGTPRFAARVKATLEAARENGQRIDFTVGPGWPMVSPAVGGEQIALAQHELVYASERLAAGAAFAGELPRPTDREDPNLTLIAVTVARLAEPGSDEGAPPLLEPDSLAALELPEGSTSIAWTAPAEGDWILFAFWSRPTGQRTIAGVTLEDAPVVDHYSEAAVAAATAYIDEHVLPAELDGLLREAAGDVFEDSLELDAKQLWTADLLAEFERRRGYDLTPYLPVIYVNDLHRFVVGGIKGITAASPADFGLPDGSGWRLRHDYYRTLNELYIERHIGALTRWANGRGLRYRAQPYGGTMDPIELAAAIQVPECENLVPLWFSGGKVYGAAEYNTYVDFVRGISAAAHMQGSSLVSLEGCAFMEGDYASTLAEKKYHVDIAFSGGVTQLVSHGFAYADVEGQPWPGWSPFSVEGYPFGVAEVWGPRQPVWRHLRSYADYVGRAAAVLRHGRPRVDLAFFRQTYWSHDWPKVRSRALDDAGYSHGVLSTALLDLPAATVAAGRLADDGAGYRALALDERAIDPHALERIAVLARAGLPTIFVGELPDRAPGFADAERADESVRELCAELLALDNVIRVADQDGLVGGLAELGLRPDSEPGEATSVYSVHRQAAEGDYYFLFNHGTAALAPELSLAGAGEARLLDLWNGTSHRLEATADGDRVRVAVDLAPGETTVVFLGQGAGLDAREGGPALRRATPRRWSRQLGPWDLEVDEWLPAGHREHRLSELSLADWRQLPDLADGSGVGVYRTSFELEPGWDEGVAGVLLDLGQVEGTVRVTVNGQVASGDCVPQRPFEVQGLLREGANELEIELATTLGNRVTADAAGEEGERAKRLAARESLASGLLGPVTLEALAGETR